MTSSSSSSSNTTTNNSYVCVFCGTPCAALYRKLTSTTTDVSLSSIKAMNCDICQRIVDPYTEREWLLVAIDCILLRPEAYRHVLYNNQDLSLPWSSCKDKNKNNISDSQNNNENNDDNNNNHTTTTTTTTTATNTKIIVHRLVQWTIISSLLHAYLKWETFVQEELHQQQEQDSSSTSSSLLPLYTIFVITSILDILVQWLAIYGFMKIVSSRRRGVVSSSRTVVSSTSTRVAYQIFLALLLPKSFQVVTICVLIWENSNTTRSFGSILIACWQCLAISLISTNNNNNNINNNNINNINNKNINNSKNSVNKIQQQQKLHGGGKLNIINNNNNNILPIPMTVLFPPVVGIVSLMVWRFAVSCLLRTISASSSTSNGNGNGGNGGDSIWWSTIPCVGFEFEVQQVQLHVHNIYHYLLHYYDNTTVIPVVSPSPSMMLCLT
jgi:hypothetical protein